MTVHDDPRAGDLDAAPPAGASATATKGRSRAAAALERFLRPPGAREPLAGTPGEIEDVLRGRLGLRPLAETRDRRLPWIAALVIALVTVAAAAIRLPRLDTPRRLMFDETYYVKDAYSLLVQGYEGTWAGEEPNALFRLGDFSALESTAAYVVHPPLGKWLISLGMVILPPENPASWRLSSAIVGILCVTLVAYLAWRLFRSVLLAGVAGLFMAVDGMAITLSRIGLLDIFLTFFVLLGTVLVVEDRLWMRGRLARRAAQQIHDSDDGRLPAGFAPRVGMRWWILGAGLALGAGAGVKWSAIYAVAVLGIVIFIWDTSARRAVGSRRWIADGVLRGGVPAFFALVPTALVAYLGAWASWFANPGAYLRTWASDLRASGEEVPRSWLPDALNSFWHYHLQMWDFHNGVNSAHDYDSHPIEWVLQLRPTLFYWPAAEERSGMGHCETGGTCTAAITSLGNPLLWWLALLGLVLVVYLAFRHRDWRAWVALSGYLSMWLPWFIYSERTIFQFYAIAFTPFVCLVLTMALAWLLGLLREPFDPLRAPGASVAPRDSMWALRRRLADDERPSLWALTVSDDASVVAGRSTWIALGIVVGAIVLVSVWYYPIWTAWVLDESEWHRRLWLPAWH